MKLGLVGNKKCPCQGQYPYHGLLTTASHQQIIHLLTKQRNNLLTYYRIRRLSIEHSNLLRAPIQQHNSICAMAILPIRGAYMPLLGYYRGEIILYRVQGQILIPQAKYNIVHQFSILSKLSSVFFDEGLLESSEKVQVNEHVYQLKIMHKHVAYAFSKQFNLDPLNYSPKVKRRPVKLNSHSLYNASKDGGRSTITFKQSICHSVMCQLQGRPVVYIANEDCQIVLVQLDEPKVLLLVQLDIAVSSLSVLGDTLLGIGLQNDCGVLLNHLENIYLPVAGPNSYITSMVTAKDHVLFSSYDGTLRMQSMLEPKWLPWERKKTISIRQQKVESMMIKERYLKKGQGIDGMVIEDMLLMVMGTDCTLTIMVLQPQPDQ